MVENRRVSRPAAVEPHERVAFEAWGLFLRVHASLVAGLDAALRESGDLTLSGYDLLAHVAGAPDRRIRLHDLEERVLFSQSTVSRLAVRLERAGLLERSVAEDDRRALEVRLTAAGARRFAAARGVAADYLREHFVGTLEAGQDAQLLAILRTLSGPPE
jgi:DNA-binding MarR family transcriptional regulator